uniref:Oxalate:formate antiporter n=1 Tax=Ascaris suum TaxID=6253 RepID=F1L519_ASCSU
MPSSDMVAVWLVRLNPLARITIVISGAVLIHLSLGTYHTFGNMLPYMASFMRNYTDSGINLEQLVWIPTFQGCFPFAMIIGGYLSARLGPRTAAFLGCFLMTSGVMLSYWTIRKSLLTFLFTYGCMFGLGQGMAYVIAVACAINWAPEHVGVVSGIVAAGFGISSSIFAPIQTMLINPWNYKPNRDGYFLEEELMERVPSVFLSLALVYAIMQTIGLVVICDPPYSCTRRDDMEPLMNDTEEKTQNYSMTTIEMLHSSTFYLLFIALFCCSFYGNMYYNLYKTFAETFIDDDMFMAFAFSVASVMNAIARIGWGLLTDKSSFQVSLSSATLLATMLLITMPVTPNGGKWLYFIWMNLMFICLAATHALFITASVKCFGTTYKSTNYGCLIVATTLSASLLAFGCEHFLTLLGYNLSFVITAAFPFTAFLITSTVQWSPQGNRIT